MSEAGEPRVRAKRRPAMYFDPTEDTGETWVATHNLRYWVSDAGRVRRVDTGRVLRPVVNPQTGYGMVQFYTGDGKGTFNYIHRLVATAFCPRPEGRLHINHKNTQRMDNRAENLEWVTPAENNAHARSIKRPAYATGSAVYTTKLTPDKVREIRSLKGTKSTRSIAIQYGVDHGTVTAIYSGRTWKEVE